MHDAGWLSFYNFFLEVVGLECCGQLEGLYLLADSGWWWPFAGAVILTELPTQLHRDDRGRLHSEHGPAISYPDDFGIYAIHGVRVPREIIEAPETITAKQIESESNLEIKRVMIDRYGQGKYLLDSGAQAIHSDIMGTLYRKDIPGDESLVMVKVRNSTPEPDGSIKDYFLRVHPQLRPLIGVGLMGEPQKMTARNAIASTFGLTGDQYAPLVET